MKTKITLNGKETEIDSDSLIELRDEVQIKAETIVCELNLKIIRNKELSSTTISEGDNLEMLQMVGGGSSI